MAAERFFDVSLQRSGAAVPWGFRLTENSRFPTVVRVNPSGVASKQVQVGDLILKINNNFTEGRSNADVLQMIKNAGNVLQLLIDRGATNSLWSSTTSGTDSVTSPTEANRQFFPTSLRNNNDPDPKPFSYTSGAPNQLAEELKFRHDAMRKERQQNLADTAASRARMSERTDSPSVYQQRQMGNKIAMANLPRFTMDDPKDFTQSDVYRLLDMEARSPSVTNELNEISSSTHSRPTLSSQSSLSDSRPDYSVKFDDHVTMYGGPEDDDDQQLGDVACYNQKSIRYLGKSNPSKSFRMLQSLIGDDDDTVPMLAPRPEVAKPNMRSVKSRAAQRKIAASSTDDSQTRTVRTPTSPTAEFTSHTTMTFNSKERVNNSFTDF